MEKLEWVYKGPNSLVDREDYLLGRKIDKTLEQLNDEEKEPKIVLPTPKNHVEYECIPPSIRDFNKIVQADQVDLNAKLQEDPLIAIKKREEEARRSFLQNPIQIKKLQEALKQQALKKRITKSKKKHSKSSLDKKIMDKLRLLKSSSAHHSSNHKQLNPSASGALDTILMHKFNALKHKLSEDDLKDILNGHVTSSSDSEGDRKKTKRKKKHRASSLSSESRSSSSEDDKRKYRKKKEATRVGSSKAPKDEKSEMKYKTKRDYDNRQKRRRSYDRSSYSPDDKKSSNKSRYRRSRSKDDRKSKKDIVKAREKTIMDDNDLDDKILAKLKLLRSEADKLVENKEPSADENKDKTRSKMFGPKLPNLINSSDSESSDSYNNTKHKAVFGLVTSDGKKIQLNQTERDKKSNELISNKKPEPIYKPERKPIKKLTEKEKEKLRMEMMQDAKVRDKEREQKVKKHRENSKKEEEEALKYRDLHSTTPLLQSNHHSVEDRIRSKLNYIQRSSSHMETNFAKR